MYVRSSSALINSITVEYDEFKIFKKKNARKPPVKIGANPISVVSSSFQFNLTSSSMRNLNGSNGMTVVRKET